jgi:hypothetical protein
MKDLTSMIVWFTTIFLLIYLFEFCGCIPKKESERFILKKLIEDSTILFGSLKDEENNYKWNREEIIRAKSKINKLVKKIETTEKEITIELITNCLLKEIDDPLTQKLVMDLWELIQLKVEWEEKKVLTKQELKFLGEICDAFIKGCDFILEHIQKEE